MSEHTDESVDQDLLLAFSTEPGEKTPESSESLGTRVEYLERTLLRSASQVESLRAEVATLVTALDDIKRAKIPGVARTQRPRRVIAVAATLFAIATGVAGWMAWPGSPIEGSPTRSVAMAAPEPPLVEDEKPREAAATTLVAPTVLTPQVSEDVPVRAARIVEEEVVYVGTLSIDADPSGGRVYIDRRAAGSTPLRVDNLKAGSHLVWIERDGYRRWTQVVQVRSDRVSRVSASLEPLAAP